MLDLTMALLGVLFLSAVILMEIIVGYAILRVSYDLWRGTWWRDR